MKQESGGEHFPVSQHVVLKADLATSIQSHTSKNADTAEFSLPAHTWLPLYLGPGWTVLVPLRAPSELLEKYSGSEGIDFDAIPRTRWQSRQ